MAKFSGKIGFATPAVETAPGVWKEGIVEKGPYFGEVVRNTRQLRETDKVNFDLSVGNDVSILADAYASENFFAMRYIEWAGTLWIVSHVEVQRPRLLLQLGGVYNGVTPSP